MKNRVKVVYEILYVLNFLIILFISLTIYMTIYKVSSDGKARDFLEVASYLPQVAWKVPTYSLILFTIIGLSNVLKFRSFNSDSTIPLYLYLIDIVLLTVISYTLNFSYNGYFLFIIAGLYLQPSWISIRMIIMVLALICFIFFDYDLFTVRMNMLSFQDYAQYFQPQIQFYLYSAKSILTSANLILIIFYFYLLINSKIRENKEFIRLNNTLKSNLKELEIANEKLEEAGRLKERNRLAHEIHDILGHSLTCISTGLEASLEVAGGSSSVLRKQLVKIKRVSDKGLQDIRRSVKELKADTIKERTLIESVEELASNINHLGKQKVILSITGTPSEMDHDEELTVYRLIQESLTNSIRHGKALTIHVSVTFSTTNLHLEINDNGIGCSKINKSFGLSHMEKQVKMLGGSIQHQSKETRGFRTTASLPLRRINIHD